jgi:hypothetical protein
VGYDLHHNKELTKNTIFLRKLHKDIGRPGTHLVGHNYESIGSVRRRKASKDTRCSRSHRNNLKTQSEMLTAAQVEKLSRVNKRLRGMLHESQNLRSIYKAMREVVRMKNSEKTEDVLVQELLEM